MRCSIDFGSSLGRRDFIISTSGGPISSLVSFLVSGIPALVNANSIERSMGPAESTNVPSRSNMTVSILMVLSSCKW